MESRSEWFKPLCIMALVLGVGGMCCDLTSLGSHVGNETLANLGNEQMKASLAIQRPYRVWMILLGIANLAQAFTMALGAGLSLRELSRYGHILRASLLAGLVLAPIALAVGMAMQFASVGALKPQPGLPENFGSMVVWVSVITGTGWVLGKMAFFVVLLRMLRKQLEVGASAPLTPN